MTPDQLREVIKKAAAYPLPGPEVAIVLNRALLLLELWEAVDESIQEAALFEPRIRRAVEKLREAQ